MIERRTVAHKLCWQGVGIHTGEQGAITVWPGEQGIRFSGPEGCVALSPAHVVEVGRCTALCAAGATFLTVEHLLSALNGLGVTDCVLEPSGPEAPILDGSALPYAEAILQCGLHSLGARERRCFEAFEVTARASRLSVRPGSGVLRVRVDFDHPAIGVQEVEVRLDPERYVRLIAPARTFGFESDAERLRAMGLARGASRENTLVFSEHGPRDTPRFPDEPVRHKLLDVIGDLALSGWSIMELDVEAERPGHEVNVRCARRLHEVLRAWEN